MLPLSGFSKPIASLRIVLLPDPATPKIALVSPRSRRKDMSLRTTFSSKASETFSNTRIGDGAPSGTLEGCSVSVGLPDISTVTKNCQQQFGDKCIHHDDGDGSGYDRLRGRSSYPLSASASRHTVVATHGCYDEPKKYWFDQPGKDIPEGENLPRRTPVLVRINPKHNNGNDRSSD